MCPFESLTVVLLISHSKPLADMHCLSKQISHKIFFEDSLW